MSVSGNPDDAKPRSDMSDMTGTDVTTSSVDDTVTVPLMPNPYGGKIVGPRIDPEVGSADADTMPDEERVGGSTGMGAPQ
jgi:hypothetical protein